MVIFDQKSSKCMIQEIPQPKTQKTGTTLAGCTFEGGVVMGADTRATSGDTIAEKRCFKVHRITVSLSDIFNSGVV